MRIKYKKPKKKPNKKDKLIKILGFFHIATIITHKNRWESITSELMNCLDESKLLKRTELFTKVYLGPKAYKYKNRINDNIKTMYAGTDLSLYEGPTLRELWKVCNATNEEMYVYYFHTKGVSYHRNTKSDSWRSHMSDAIISNWKKCIKTLDSGEKTCGIMWRSRQTCFYAGNFWWARASYIRTLEKPQETSDRMYFEKWLKPPKQIVLEGYPSRPIKKGKKL